MKKQNKNLFVAQKIVDDSNNVDVYLTNDGFIRFKTGANRLIIKPTIIKENTSYTLKLIVKSGVDNTNNINFIAYYSDGTNEILSRNLTTNTNEFVVLAHTNSAKTLVNIKDSYTDGKEAFIKIEGSMILEGSYTTETIPSYVPHQEQNLPFTFEEGQFLADDEELQVNGIYKKYAQVDLSSLTWSQYATNKYSSSSLTALIKPPESSLVKGNILAEKYIVVRQSVSFVHGNIGVTPNGDILCCDTTGTPSGILQYELAEPITIPYNSTQQAQYEAIKNATTYKGTTYIEATSSELPPLLEIQYWKEKGSE